MMCCPSSCVCVCLTPPLWLPLLICCDACHGSVAMYRGSGQLHLDNSLSNPDLKPATRRRDALLSPRQKLRQQGHTRAAGPDLACPGVPSGLACPLWPGLPWLLACPGLAWPGLASLSLAWLALACLTLPCPALPCPALPWLASKSTDVVGTVSDMYDPRSQTTQTTSQTGVCNSCTSLTARALP